MNRQDYVWGSAWNTDQYTHMKFDQMKFIFWHSHPCSPHTTSIGVAVLGSHWSKNSSTAAGARGVVVIVVGNGHGDTSSNPGRDWLHFT